MRVSRWARWAPPVWFFWVLAASTISMALAKGFARHVHPYALSQYAYSYEHGFLIRGLPGQLVRFACGDQATCWRTSAETIGTLALLGFAPVLLFVVRGQAATRASLLLVAAVASGPALVSLGATRGYHDALTLLLGLLAYHWYRHDRFVLSITCFCTALLVHELVAFYILPLYLLEPSLFRRRDWSRTVVARVATIAALGAATLGVVHFGHADRQQKREIGAALKHSAPELEQGFRAYRRFGMLAATKRAPITTKHTRTLDQRRYHRYWLTPLLLASTALALATWKRRFAELPLWLFVCALPHTIYLVAWDVDRMLSLTGVTALFVVLEILRRCDIRQAPLLALVPVVGLIILQLREPYSQLTRRYARGDTLLVPKRPEMARPSDAGKVEHGRTKAK